MDQLCEMECFLCYAYPSGMVINSRQEQYGISDISNSEG